MLGGDFSQQEVRCMAYFTQEPTLVAAYQSGRDVYSSLAAEFYGKPYEECGDGTPERSAMKVVVLAVMYGMGAGALADMLGISVDEAKRFMDEFFEKMPKVSAWTKSTQKFAQQNGFVWMDGQQRKRRLPAAKKKTRGYDPEASRAMRQAGNAVIQGTSAIQTKTTLVRLHEHCKRKGWKIVLTIHDEQVILVPETITREEVAEFEDILVNTYVFGNIPNKTDLEFYQVWGKGIKVDEWFKLKEEN